MDKIEKHNYKDMYEMKVIEFLTEENNIFKTVELRKISNENYLSDIYVERKYNKNDKETVYIDFKLGTVAYGSLNEEQWNEYINNLSESKKAYDYFKSIINETTGYKVVEK